MNKQDKIITVIKSLIDLGFYLRDKRNARKNKNQNEKTD